MMEQSERLEQRVIVHHALDFVARNITSRISVSDIADHVGYSSDYTSRLFHEIVGESLYSHVKRRKVEMAASLLLRYRDLSITEIANEIGYSSSNFTPLFRSVYQTTPRQFRRGVVYPWTARNQVRMVERVARFRVEPDTRLVHAIDRRVEEVCLPAGWMHRRRCVGPYRELHAAWRRFIARWGRSRRYIGVCYSDPLVTPRDLCAYEMGFWCDTPVAADDVRIGEATYVTYPYRGGVQGIHMAFHELLSYWAPNHLKWWQIGRIVELYEPAFDGEIEMRVAVELV